MTAALRPLVLEAALNGMTQKAANPNVPRSVDEIVASALACVEAGASIVHNHNDEPNFGGPSRHSAGPYIEVWRRVLDVHPKLLLHGTMAGAAPETTIEERFAHMVELHDAGLLDMALADTGTVAIAIAGDGGPIPLPFTYGNTAADVAYIFDWCRANDVAVNVAVFEPGFLRLALAHNDAGTLPRAKIQLYFGGDRTLMGLPATESALRLYLEMLEGADLPWMVGVIGGDVTRSLAGLAIRLGGHVRVGLEDYAGPGAPRNEDLVAEMAAMAREFGREVARSDDVRHVLWP